jgi:hypothetical protein|tara:strand:+ start:504 stop:695 length:192 start_codon:yes stop_codon:yes gene_type:complete
MQAVVVEAETTSAMPALVVMVVVQPEQRAQLPAVREQQTLEVVAVVVALEAPLHNWVVLAVQE